MSDWPGCLERGERAPDFVLPSGDGTPTRFYGLAGGRPAALVLAGGRTDAEAVAGLVRALVEAEVPFYVVAGAGVVPASAPGSNGCAFVDSDGSVRQRYRLHPDDPGRLLVLNPNLRVRATFLLSETLPDSTDIRARVHAAGDADSPVEVDRQAPVLLVPDALDREDCGRLMEHFEAAGSEETGVEASAGAGREVILRPEAKRRRDHTVRDEALLRELTRSVGRRVMPELRMAFAYRATRFEGFKIACYREANRGHFLPHRDNLSPSTAHRRFALTLNLNDGYEGGHLRFPEYGPQLYRPPAGGALIFSCSLLHEALPVTRSHRFVLLSFLFGDEATRRPGPALT